MNTEKFEGAARNAAGHVEQAYGDIAGDNKASAKGGLERAAGTAQSAMGDAEDKILSISDKVVGFWKNASDDVTQATQKMNDTIHQKPVHSSLVALGLGVLVGLFISR